jgi:uncharacterized protein
MRKLDMVVLGLLIAGGLNWGLLGLFNFNLVEYIFGNPEVIGLIYVLMGGAAVYYAIRWARFFNRHAKH